MLARYGHVDRYSMELVVKNQVDACVGIVLLSKLTSFLLVASEHPNLDASLTK